MQHSYCCTSSPNAVISTDNLKPLIRIKVKEKTSFKYRDFIIDITFPDSITSILLSGGLEVKILTYFIFPSMWSKSKSIIYKSIIEDHM